MIAYLIYDLNVRGGTHKQFLKLLEYTEAQGEPFFIVTRFLDFDKTYPEFRRYADRIRVLEEERGSRSVPARVARTLRARRRLAEMVSDADVVNIHDCGFETLLPAFRGKRVVWQINDLYYVFQTGVSASSRQSLRNRALKRIILNGLKYVDEITVNVTKNAERVKRCMGRDAKVLYCGVEPVGITRDINETFGRFDSRRVNLLSSGVWFPYRNYEAQVETVSLLVSRGYDVHLDIIGSTSLAPDYVRKIEEMIASRGLGDRIEICGMVDEKRFRELHERDDMFLFVNVDQSWGLAVFEAMSCGLPVIVSESVGATEILHDGVDSLFVNPKSPEAIAGRIENLMDDRSLYTRISDTASRFHQQYTWDKAYSAPMLKLLKKSEK